MTSDEIKEAIRQKYAWPGGYQLYAVCSDGGILCTACMRQELHQILRSTRTGASDGWCIEAIEYADAGEPESCDHCGDSIE